MKIQKYLATFSLALLETLYLKKLFLKINVKKLVRTKL
jgi:hypothetical protein